METKIDWWMIATFVLIIFLAVLILLPATQQPQYNIPKEVLKTLCEQRGIEDCSMFNQDVVIPKALVDAGYQSKGNPVDVIKPNEYAIRFVKINP